MTTRRILYKMSGTTVDALRDFIKYKHSKGYSREVQKMGLDIIIDGLLDEEYGVKVSDIRVDRHCNEYECK